MLLNYENIGKHQQSNVLSFHIFFLNIIEPLTIKSLIIKKSNIN